MDGDEPLFRVADLPRKPTTDGHAQEAVRAVSAGLIGDFRVINSRRFVPSRRTPARFAEYGNEHRERAIARGYLRRLAPPARRYLARLLGFAALNTAKNGKTLNRPTHAPKAQNRS
jgi:hypothetical protein